MALPKLSLQVLEAFEHVARSGSMQRAAQEMGLSVSSISHHVARLEETLGVVLFDRSSRPFALTREGRETLYHLGLGLHHLRRATSETMIVGLLGARSLRIGLVEDFESNLAPDLAVILSGRMPRATLSVRNVLSHEAPELLRRGELDIAIATAWEGAMPGLTVDPLLRDPFVIVAPDGVVVRKDDLMAGGPDLPFLRFNPAHQIGRQIEANLARNRIVLPERFTFDTVPSIMAVVASGAGWSIITPLGYARAQRFAETARLSPLPVAPFARRICLVARSDFDRPTAQAMAALVRSRMGHVVVEPVIADHPWLDGPFGVLDPDG